MHPTPQPAAAPSLARIAKRAANKLAHEIVAAHYLRVRAQLLRDLQRDLAAGLTIEQALDRQQRAFAAGCYRL